MTRSKALLIVIPFGLSMALLLLLPLLIDKDKVLELAASALHEQTGATLTVAGASSLSFFPTLGVALTDAALAMPGEEQPGLEARSLAIGVRLLPLLTGSAQIDSIALDGLTVKIRSGAKTGGKPQAADTSGLSDRELDVFYADRRQAAAEAGQHADAGAALALPLALNVQHLTVTDSRIEQVDSAGQTTDVTELASLEASGLNLDGAPIALQLLVKRPGTRTLEISLDGTARVDQDSQQLELDEMEVVVTGASAEPIRLKTRGKVDLSRQVADLTLSLATGDTRGEGSLRYARFESPQIDTRLKLNLLNPALLALAGPEAAAGSGGGPAATGGDEPLPLDAIRRIDTRAELSIEKAVFDNHTIDKLVAKLRIVEGSIQLGSLTGTLHGGRLDARGTFNGRYNTATLDSTGKLDQLDIAELLAATGGKPLLAGRASLDWTLASKGRTRNELVAALTGPVKLATSQVVLKDISVEHMLCQAVALTNQEQLTASFPASTAFTTLGADIQLADGKARLDPLQAELPQVTLTGTGNFDLLSKDFRTTFKARLSPELEALDRACRVSKRLTAIDWPVDCKGNIDGEPAKWCSVDSKAIVEDLGKGEAKRKIQKEAGKLLDKLFNR